MIEGNEVIAYGFEQFKEEDKAGFKLDQIMLNGHPSISCICAGIENLIVALQDGTVLRSRSSGNNNFETIKEQKEEVKGSKEIDTAIITKMYIDVYGYHCILLSAEGKAFYLHYERDYLIPLEKLKGLNITAIAFNVNPRKETTEPLLIGTQTGQIFTYRIKNRKDKIDEEKMSLVLELPSKLTIYGLAFDTYQCRIKNTEEIGSTTLVVVFTRNSWYQFTGKLPFAELFKRFATPSDIERNRRPVPGEEVKDTEVKFFYTKDNEGLMELSSFVWKFGIGVCRGQFRRRNDLDGHVSIKDLITDAYQTKDMEVEKRVEIPEAIGITEFYVFFLYSNSVIAISKITRGIEYSATFRASEKMKQMVYETGSSSMWIHSYKSLYKLTIKEINKGLWKKYLAGSNFKAALRLCKEEDKDNYGYVAGIYADSKFKDEKYLEAAELYACSTVSLEEVARKFLLEEKLEGLERYLTIRLENISKDKSKKTQQVLLSAWIVSLKLEKLKKASAVIENENTRESINSPPKRSLYRKVATTRSLSEDLVTFLNKYDDCLDTETIYQLLQNNGRLYECIQFAEYKCQYEAVVSHFINSNLFERALEFIVSIKEEDKKNEIMMKYATIFMSQAKEKTAECLLRHFSKIDAERLAPALMSIDKKDRPQFNDFLKERVHKDSYDSTGKLLSNLYLFFLADNPSEEAKEELIDFITKQEILIRMNQKVSLDKDFALNVCKHFNNGKAQVKVYAMLGFYEEAVRLALNINEFDLAKEYANLPKDFKTKKRLWQEILGGVENTERVKKRELDSRMCVDIIEQSKGVIVLSDLLPYLKDDVKINEFKKTLEDHIQSLEKRMKELKEEIDDFNKNAKSTIKGHKDFQGIPIKIRTERYCNLCGKILIGNHKFLLFPCLHGFHTHCLIKEIFKLEDMIELKRLDNIYEIKDDKKKEEMIKLAKNLKKRLDKLNALNNFIKKMLMALKTCGIALTGANKPEVVEYVGKLLSRDVSELSGMKKGVRITSEDRKTLEFFNNQLESKLIDECLLCGTAAIDEICVPIDSPEKDQWVFDGEEDNDEDY